MTGSLRSNLSAPVAELPQPLKRIFENLLCLDTDRPVIFLPRAQAAAASGRGGERILTWSAITSSPLRGGSYVERWGKSPVRFLTATEDVQTENVSTDADEDMLLTTTIHSPRGPVRSVMRMKRDAQEVCVRTEHWVKAPADIDRVLAIPYEPVRFDVQAYREFRGGAEAEGAAVQIMFQDPVAHVHDLLGSELLAVWSLEEASRLEHLASVFTDRLVDLLEKVLAVKGRCPAIITFIGAEYAGPPLLRPAEFGLLVTEPMKRIARFIHARGGICHIHCHGKMREILDDFLEMGIDVLDPLEEIPQGDITLSVARARTGNCVCLQTCAFTQSNHRWKHSDLWAHTAPELRDIARSTLDDAWRGTGLVVPLPSPPAESAAAVEKARALYAEVFGRCAR